MSESTPGPWMVEAVQRALAVLEARIARLERAILPVGYGPPIPVSRFTRDLADTKPFPNTNQPSLADLAAREKAAREGT